MPGAASSSGTLAWIQWVYVDSAAVELATVFAYGVEPDVALAIDEQFDDGISNNGKINVTITTAPNGQVASVQYNFTFRLK